MAAIALTACSNGRKDSDSAAIQALTEQMTALGIRCELSPFLYESSRKGPHNGRQRADDLMRWYRDSHIDAIFDVSGGDEANELLPYLDWDLLKKHPKPFAGYSDLTTVLNAIYAKTGQSTALFQLKTLVWDSSGIQTKRLKQWITQASGHPFEFPTRNASIELFTPVWKILQGDRPVSGESAADIVIGGNVRCFLKLAGTPYFPNVKGRTLFLESYGGGVPKLRTYFAQLQQMGVFEEVSTLLLGTFTEFERDSANPPVWEILREYIPKTLPVAKTEEVGHGKCSKGLVIGSPISL